MWGANTANTTSVIKVSNPARMDQEPPTAGAGAVARSSAVLIVPREYVDPPTRMRGP